MKLSFNLTEFFITGSSPLSFPMREAVNGCVCNFIKMRLQHKCFSVSIAICLRTAFL